MFLLKKGIVSVRLDSDVTYRAPVLTAKVTRGFAEGKGSASARALVEHYKSEAANDDKTGWGVAARYELSSFRAFKSVC